ncbi:cadherin-5 [Bufo gargarizans]|uniref:cadherin-5 n=1 Tax=Bufo gargarizans TaxID=30331 RepID=UPI001CF2D28F|nr:cadherin-5 [Bufo gargarizans]
MMKLPLLHLLVSINIFHHMVLCTKNGAHQQGQLESKQRVKRAWVWNQITTLEEQTNIPYLIGTLHSTKLRNNAMYILQGEFVNTLFKVKENTGDIYGYEKLDREEKAQYNLTALLVDKNTLKTLEPPEIFSIRLIDINDNAPAFTQESYNGSVPEMSATDVLVTTVTAVDPDDPTVAGHAKVTYKILQGYEHFKINENTGEILTLSSYLDRETKASYEVIVQAKDSPGLTGGFSSSATVTIHLTDINDNFPTFTKKQYTFDVHEDLRVGEVVGRILVEDIDEPQNRLAKYTFMKGRYEQWFQIKSNPQTNEGIIILKKPLDYESIDKVFRMSIEVTDPSIDLRVAKQQRPSSTTEVVVNVLDVDEPPEFSQPFYLFKVKEDEKNKNIGFVLATDPDSPKRAVRYSDKSGKDDSVIVTSNGSIHIKSLDRETRAWHNITVTAEEIDYSTKKSSDSPTMKSSSVSVYIQVLDVNDNAPEFAEPYAPRVCENTANNLAILTISATDKDEMVPGTKFTYYSAEKETNFTVVDNHDNTASIVVKNGAFNRDVTKFYYLPIVISDNGMPSLSSTNTLTINVCKCNEEGEFTFCEEALKYAAVSASTIIIILCSLALILLIVLASFLILRRMRSHHPMILVKNPAEIHEQLVTYDEEGGGEMDTNGYDVSVLNSVRRNVVRSKPDMEAYPSLYAQVQKPSRNGDMFSVIEAKKEDADNDGECLPYDTLHIFGYEGSESIVESLSSLESGSSDSEIDYDVLNDWGPRFKMLADLYGLEHLEDFPY